VEDMDLADAFAGRRVLVTGHTGFKGSWLALWLHGLGAQVTGYALDPPTDPSHFEAAATGELLERDVRADVRDADALGRAVDESAPEVVFHLAAQALVRFGYREPAETFHVNAQGTVNLLEAVRRAGRPCVVVAVTSDKCYENDGRTRGYVESDPMGGRDPYSASKGAAEIMAAAYRRSFFGPDSGVRLASVRAGNAVGGGDWAEDRVVPDTIRALTAGHPVRIRNPGAVRPWQHVLEPLSGYLTLAARLLVPGDREELCGAWNFAPPRDRVLDVRGLVERLIASWGEGTWESAAAPGQPPESAYLRLDAAKAERQLGWRPRWTIDEALRRVVEWHRATESARDVSRAHIAAYEAAEASG